MMKNLIVSLFLILLGIITLSSCSDSKDGGGTYDPSKPMELLSFFPDSGKYLEKVILSGKNFDTNPNNIKVYFNSRPAGVIGSDGEHMYVVAPRLPGDTCMISVVIGKDSLTYPDIFRYKTSVTVSTVVGNGNMAGSAFKEGSLGEAIVQPRYLCMDSEDNLFAVNRVEGAYHVLRVDEENDEVSVIARDIIGNVPAADPETGIVSLPVESGGIGSFYTMDPREFWGPRYRSMKFEEGVKLPDQPWKHAMVVNPEDGYIYTRYYHGQVVKIHPRTYEATIICLTSQGDTYGLTFNPLKPNILYLSMWGNCGAVANSICSIDVSADDPASTFTRLSSSLVTGGHRDGELSIAQFRDPSQIFCDAEGNMYIADYGNHCIRRITPEGMVETTLGIPENRGWKDGGKEEALFNNPAGIGISSDGSVYVADFNNARIRKLSIN